MQHTLDEDTRSDIAKSLNERFGQPLTYAIVESIVTCQKCGGMLDVSGDACTRCGLMPTEVNVCRKNMR